MARKASSSSRRPLRIPLLRRVVAIPNEIPDISTRRSCLIEGRFRDPRLFVNNQQPKKLKRAHELSAYGAERKIPAGDMMCKKDAPMGNVAEPGNRTAVSLNKASADKK